MSARDSIGADARADCATGTGAASAGSLAGALSTAQTPVAAMQGIIVGELVGFAEGGRTPLVIIPGQPGTAALAARSVVDLHGAHIGKQVVLMFEATAPRKAIVMGVLSDEPGWPPEAGSAQVVVDADGERLIVSAKDQLVLRCGLASITLTKAGKVLIRGTFVASSSSGVNRVKGGSVQLN